MSSAARLTMKLPPLSRDELLRYSRHLAIPDVGVEGQRRLKASRVLVVGAGGLGSPAALYLAAAGVGTLGLVDYDVVDLSNLQRQILHGTTDVGRPKLESARDRVLEANPEISVEIHETQLTSANALEIIGQYDIIVDGSDNFPTRYLSNDACVILGKPNVYGSVFRFEGQASVFATETGPCYRCLFREPPPHGLIPTCAEGGVLGVLPGLIGVIQATETIKLILGKGEPLIGRLLLVDALRMQFRTMTLERDPKCPACGTREIHQLIDYDEFCGVPRSDGMAASPSSAPSLTPSELAAALASGEPLDLIDVREPWEWETEHMEGARLVPLASLPSVIPALDRTREIVVYCRAGGRSEKAAAKLREAGFFKVRYLVGGMDGIGSRESGVGSRRSEKH